jgi:hypothetical protein
MATLTVVGGKGESAPAGSHLTPSGAYAHVTTIIEFFKR